MDLVWDPRQWSSRCYKSVFRSLIRPSPALVAPRPRSQDRTRDANTAIIRENFPPTDVMTRPDPTTVREIGSRRETSRRTKSQPALLQPGSGASPPPAGARPSCTAPPSGGAFPSPVPAFQVRSRRTRT
jgi:hypothetical protein